MSHNGVYFYRKNVEIEIFIWDFRPFAFSVSGKGDAQFLQNTLYAS